MTVSIFTNEGCKNCESAKQLMGALGIEYTELDAASHLDPTADDYFTKHPDWRTTGAVDALALLQLDNELPVVIIDGEAMPYREAMNFFLGESEDAGPIAVDFKHEKCTDGVCALAV